MNKKVNIGLTGRTQKMTVVSELIRAEADGSISFGNYELDTKTKVSDFEHEGNIYKVKTFKDITKLERNDMFVYESVPGTVVSHFSTNKNGISFAVSGVEDAQITVELEADTEYQIQIDGNVVDCQQTNLGGKLSMSVELAGVDGVDVSVVKK